MDLVIPARRRRGKQLEDAILAAGWELLLEEGYHAFTIDAVAERATTSRSVIYRRWADRSALMEASLTFGLNRGRQPAPDTGSLRTDVIDLLEQSNGSRGPIAALMSVFLGSYYAESGRTFADLRERAFGASAGRTMDVILDRAVHRGEVDPSRLTPRVRTVAFDLYRHDLMMTLAPLSSQQIVAIVDDVFLPLVRLERGAEPGIL